MDRSHLFIYSSVDGHLGHFQLLAIVNTAVVKMGVNLFESLFSFLRGTRAKLLGYVLILGLVLEEILNCFLQ